MKFKFVADGKDILMFVIFAIFLLYIVALGVLNFPSLAGTGKFYGILPFEAFTPKYITYTLVFYVIALGALFMSVSSYFFEMESGVGISTSKKDKGYSRWAKEKDMKSELKCVHPSDSKAEVAGIPLICNGKELWVDDGEFHNLVIGATGSGKTQCTILPAVNILAKRGESIVCTDPKGEIYEETGQMLRDKGYNIILLNFRNPQKGNAWNPLSLPYQLYTNDNKDKAIELLDDLALNILYDESNNNADPFWEKTSADYFSGLSLAMFDDTTEDKININTISLTTTIGEEKCGGSTYVKEYFAMKDPNSPAYINASGTIMAPSETKGSIIAVFKQKIKLFSSRENLSEMLSHSDFDIESIGKNKTAVFIIIQDEKKTYHSLATIFVKQCYETLIDVAQQNGGKLPIRTNFLLDEFANMPPLKDVTTMITAARSRQIRFTMIIQNFAQLTQVYGKENAETIKGNCGNMIYLISTELAALEEISKLCGEVKSKKDDKTASTPLVTVSDLQRMKQFDQIVLRMRSQPFKTSFVPYFKLDWGKKYDKATYPEREKKPVSVFDIRDYVKEKKQEKIKNMMSESFPNGEAPSASGGVKPPFTPQANFSPMTSNQSAIPKPPSKPVPDFDVNDLVKKIDAKIAAIEKEEKEKASKENKPLETKQTEEKIEEVKIEKKTVVKEEIPLLEEMEDEIPLPRPRPTLIPPKPREEVKKVVKEETITKEVEEIPYERSKLLPPLKEKIVEKEVKETKIIEKQPLFTSESIENKVNDKLKNLFSSSFDDSFNEPIPLGKPVIKDNYIEKKEIITEVKENETSYEEIITDAKVVEEKPLKTETVRDIIKPTPTIKLEDVSDDDKFFDDFFDD